MHFCHSIAAKWWYFEFHELLAIFTCAKLFELKEKQTKTDFMRRENFIFGKFGFFVSSLFFLPKIKESKNRTVRTKFKKKNICCEHCHSQNNEILIPLDYAKRSVAES